MPDDNAKSVHFVSDERFARFTTAFGISELINVLLITRKLNIPVYIRASESITCVHNAQ